jgi:error-prone DNA polymerase
MPPQAIFLGFKLMVVKGNIQREGEHAEVPITHLICKTLIDRTDLLNRLMYQNANLPWGDAALERADEVRRPNLGSGSLGPCSRGFH